MNVRTEKALMTMACFVASCANRCSSNSSGYVQFDYHRGCIFVPLLTCVLEDVKVLCLNPVLCIVGYDPVLRLLALKRLQKIEWLSYGRTDPALLGYKSMSGQVFHVPPLKASSMLKSRSAIVTRVPGRQSRYVRDIHFAIIISCKYELQSEVLTDSLGFVQLGGEAISKKRGR